MTSEQRPFVLEFFQTFLGKLVSRVNNPSLNKKLIQICANIIKLYHLISLFLLTCRIGEELLVPSTCQSSTSMTDTMLNSIRTKCTRKHHPLIKKALLVFNTILALIFSHRKHFQTFSIKINTYFIFWFLGITRSFFSKIILMAIFYKLS